MSKFNMDFLDPALEPHHWLLGNVICLVSWHQRVTHTISWGSVLEVGHEVQNPSFLALETLVYKQIFSKVICGGK